MIYAFCIAAHVCGESTAHWWIPLQAINGAELCCLINVLMSCSTNCGDSSEKTRETHIMLYCYGNLHSKIDDITGSQGITGVDLCWSNVTGFHRRWYPSQKFCLIFFSCLPERTAKQTVELPVGWNPMTRMRCRCYVSFVNPTFHMVEHWDHYVANILNV